MRAKRADATLSRELKAALSGRRPSKYRNRKTVVDGITFHSAREARRYKELELLVLAGEISGLTCQFPMTLVVNGQAVTKYIADFVYEEPAMSDNTIYEDCKGFRTAEYKLKVKLMKAVRGITIRET